MKFCEFEKVMSAKRMSRYLNACGRDTRKAMTLYRLNLKLGEEMFTVLSCYEVALRNAIDRIMSECIGEDWIRDSIKSGGVFDNPKFHKTTRMMKKAYAELIANGKYTNSKMLAAMEFGVWKSTIHLMSDYNRVMTLFGWMGIDGHSLLFGMDRVKSVCTAIENIKGE